MNHDLKCSPDQFAEVRAGRKTFDIRLNDRNFAIGDTLCLREFLINQGGKYTGEFEMRAVTHIMPGGSYMNGTVVSPKYVIMSMSPIGDAEEGARGHSKVRGEF